MSVRIALNHQKQLGTSSPCPHLGIQRGEASTKFDLQDRSLEPFLPSRSPRTDASSLYTPAFPLRGAPVCARRQATTSCLRKIIWQRGPSWEPRKMDLISFTVKRKPLLESLERLLVRWSCLVVGGNANGF
ncbi:hypothetical protein T08_16283 [Trichinella sp. T8]|nr:hypothetical protein T08_11903 [Trichinella sp. T8]KRZ81666.1 hypothetical protein T08_16283 [Trichinella sp. T8]